MEVLPSSGVRSVVESDCAPKGSGTTFMYDEESSYIGHGRPIQKANVKLDVLVPTVEGTQSKPQWIVDELPASEGHCHGASNLDEVENQNISHASDDDDLNSEDQSIETCFASESSHPIVDTIDSVGESALSEFKWPEQDEPLAVWVKWRGKWQSGIRCMRADWPLQTLKAKPTHDRKKYSVIFFPRKRNYSWADVLFVRPINEFPQPIAYKTHKVGVKIVKDLTVARRFIMQKLAVGMINIIDQLRNQALVETARNVTVWKGFALEASRCDGYSDLGRMLLKLQNMILQRYISSDWLQKNFQSWVLRCQNAQSAESIEILKEELYDSILWNEVNMLSDTSVQPELGSEMKNWKHEVMKWFSTSNPISSGGGLQQLGNDTPMPMGLQISRKRPKLEVRRAEAHASHVETQVSNPAITVETESRFFSGRDGNAGLVESGPSRSRMALESASPIIYPANGWGMIVVEAGHSEVIQAEEVEAATPVNGVVSRKSLDSANKNRQCAAFIEAKGRQCVRWANDGDVYCCVHLASRFVGNSPKTEATPTVNAPMCEGTTVLGTKCKHRSLFGSSFCKKHRPHDDNKMSSTPLDNKLKRKHGESINRSETSYCKEIVLMGETETPIEVAPISAVVGGEASNFNCLIETPDNFRKDYDGPETHCIGSCEEGSNPCLETPKRHSLYCDKHLPSWLKRARNGKSRIISKEVFLDLLKDCYSQEHKLRLHQACELFYRLFKSILSLRNPVPKEIQLQWAISEASKDINVGEFLMKLVCNEKERLRRIWGISNERDAKVSSSIEGPVSVPAAAKDSDHDKDDTIKCKICSDKLYDDQALAAHWMESHKKEAHRFFRDYVCAICLDSFTDKKVLEAHVQERHHAQFVEQCMLFQCKPCGSHFGNMDQLWLHVQSAHPVDLRLPRVPQQNTMSMSEDSSQKFVSFENNNSENQDGFRKFICRFCGLKFDLLPDLGRHHQAAHMGANGPRPSKRGIRFYAYKLKSGRLSRPRFKKGLGSVSYRMRNRSSTTLKKRVQVSNSVGTGETQIQTQMQMQMQMQSHVTEAGSLGKLMESQCSTVAKKLFSEIQRTKPRPNNHDILSMARSACCKVGLQASLEQKYGLLPDRLYLRAAKLCSEHNIQVDWHQQGFVCLRGCKSATNSQLPSSLSPLFDSAVHVNSTLSSDPVSNEWEMDECHYIIDSRHIRQDVEQKTIILCDDISFGRESVPVACVIDENLLGSLPIHTYSSGGATTAGCMPWENFTYVMKPLLNQTLSLEAECLQLGCACMHSTCSPEACDHVYLFDNDYEDAKDIHGKPMRGRFAYDENGRIVLEEGYLVYECNHMCSCSLSCHNRVLQNGVKVKLEVFKTVKKGWAVRTREAILRGAFVCEFIGEVIDEHEANERRNRYGGESCRYFYDIDAHINDMSRLIEGQVTYVIDATNYGNVSRYINHSCSPNLVNHQVLVESMDSQMAHIGLYASRDIAAGEELTYDYRYKLLAGEGCLCHCGASNCRGRLY